MQKRHFEGKSTPQDENIYKRKNVTWTLERRSWNPIFFMIC